MNPSLANQKLLSDVVSAAFSRIDGLNLRRHVNGKNVAVQVSTTYRAETSALRAHAGFIVDALALFGRISTEAATSSR